MFGISAFSQSPFSTLGAGAGAILHDVQDVSFTVFR